MRRALGIAAAVCAVFALATEGLALTLTLSSLSNDETPASVLDATFDIAVSGSTLTITVTNQSAYIVNELYFNASSDVTSLTLSSVVGGGGTRFWGLETAEARGQPTHVGGIGTFDYALLDGRGANRGILPGRTAVFTLDISGAGPFEVADFVELTGAAGPQSPLVAAKFVAGPGDDSAFGAVIPEGDSLRLFSVGLLLVASAPVLGLARRRRAVAEP